MAKRFNVYRQDNPQPISDKWYAANLVKVGEADSMEEAKRLTAAPVLEAKEAAQ